MSLPEIGGVALICSGIRVHMLNDCQSVVTHLDLPLPMPLFADQSGSQPVWRFSHQSPPIWRMFLHIARSSGLLVSSNISLASQVVKTAAILFVSTWAVDLPHRSPRIILLFHGVQHQVQGSYR